MQLIFGLFATVMLVVSNADQCDSLEALDIIFIVDSSGSVYDDGFNNWQSELDLVNNIIQYSLPINSRVGLINFSGCGPSFSLDQCKEQGRLHKVFGLNEFGDPNDLQLVYDTVDTMGPGDFLGGYTWTEPALQVALEEFMVDSKNNSNKIIVLITDGEPYLQGQEVDVTPCRTSDGYFSDTLLSLRDLDVEIITVGIDIVDGAKDEFFQCMTPNMDDYFFDGDFNTLPDLYEPIGELICNEIEWFPSSTMEPIFTSTV